MPFDPLSTPMTDQGETSFHMALRAAPATLRWVANNFTHAHLNDAPADRHAAICEALLAENDHGETIFHQIASVSKNEAEALSFVDVLEVSLVKDLDDAPTYSTILNARQDHGWTAAEIASARDWTALANQLAPDPHALALAQSFAMEDMVLPRVPSTGPTPTGFRV